MAGFCRDGYNTIFKMLALCAVKLANYVSVDISRNKPQTKSAIFKLNYYLIQANNKKIIYTMDHYNQ